MRSCLILILFVLVGCSHTITLYPRADGGEQATGTVNDGSRKMTVLLKGETYKGSYVLEQSTGIGLVNGSVVTVSSNTNNATALLAGEKRVLRCNFKIVAAQGGSGTCVEGSTNDIYDMLIN